MFSKPNSSPQAPKVELPPDVAARQPNGPRKGASLIAAEMTFEGNISGGGELQVDGIVKGDIRVERVTVGDGGQVDGSIFAEAVEVRALTSSPFCIRRVFGSRVRSHCKKAGLTWPWRWP